MVQYNGFPNRLLELVRSHGNRSHIYSRDLQGYSSMVKVFKESHEKDVERLAADRRHETESITIVHRVYIVV